MGDFIESVAPSKLAHDWEQSKDEAEYIIKNLTIENQTVLDPMMGIGNHRNSCIESRRKKKNFIGIEKDLLTFEFANVRIMRLKIKMVKNKMIHLEYKSLVTKETIDHYLSIIEDEKTKKNFMSTISKFDIKISTKPVIEEEEFYYKIWILRRGTHKKAHIKEYYSIELLDEKFKSSSSLLTLSNILDMIRLNTDVPDDFEEYCEIYFKDPMDPIGRIDYLDHLKRAERFKKFITQEEIKSFPFIFEENNQAIKEEKIKSLDLNDEHTLKLLGYSFVFLNDKREYDKLAELQNTLDYQARIVESYGYDTYKGEFNEKVFPITKEDNQMKSIAKDFKNYESALMEYDDYLKHLVKKYNIKQSGNILKRVAFNIEKKDDNTLEQDSRYINTVIDNTYF